MSKQTWEEIMDFITEDGTAVANTTTETILFPDFTVPAKYMDGGRVLLLEAYGRFSTTATPTVRFRVRWGGVAGTTLWDSGTITTATVTAALWKVRVWVQCRTGGSSTASILFAIGEASVGSAAAPSVGSATGAPAVGLFGSAGDDTPATVGSLNTLIDQALSLTLTWSAASASNTMTGHFRAIRSCN